MKSYSKKIFYENQAIDIIVQTNYRLEKRIGGKSEHLITVKCTELNYSKDNLCETSNLQEILDLMIDDAYRFINETLMTKTGKTQIDEILENLDFTRLNY